MREEQYQVRGMFQEAAPPSGGPPVTVPAIMPLLSGTPGRTKWAGVPYVICSSLELLTIAEVSS